MERANSCPGNQTIERYAVHSNFGSVCDKGDQNDDYKPCPLRH